MAIGETVIDPRTGQVFEVVWDAAAERRGETFRLVQPYESRPQSESQPRDAQQWPLRSQRF